MSKAEHILAVRNQRDLNEGFTKATGFKFEPEDIMIGSRIWLESDAYYKQLIPYTLVASGGKVLAYIRKPAGGEERLHGKVSVGWGGHVNVIDLAHRNGVIDANITVSNAIHRELEEEIFLSDDTDFCWSPDFKGFIYDSSNEVGQVHLGLVYVAELWSVLADSKHKITSEDDGIQILGFFDPEYLLESEEVDLENWSRLALEGLK